MALPRGFFYGCALRRARTAEESGIHGCSALAIGANTAIFSLRQTVDALGHEYVVKTHMVVETIDRSILRERLFAILSAFFGILALLLAGVGLYGLMAYNVTRRTQ